jgi:hypothetical protein
MRGKRPKPWEAYDQARRQREQFASKLSKLNPDVEEIRGEFRFTPNDPPQTPRDQTKVWWPDSDAFFEINCLDRECICGGFDLSRVIGEALRNRQTVVEGQLTCAGWQDRERYRKNTCYNTLDYRLAIKYR